MQRHSAGFSLIESLVAMTVFLVGSTCTATWLIWSLGVDARASRSMAATVAARNLSVRMRANPDALVAGRYMDTANTSSDCFHGCDLASLAADDLARFRATLVASMGAAAEGTVTCQGADTCTIHVTWQGRDELAWPVRP